jgi:hypothetical protein
MRLWFGRGGRRRRAAAAPPELAAGPAKVADAPELAAGPAKVADAPEHGATETSSARLDEALERLRQKIPAPSDEQA